MTQMFARRHQPTITDKHPELFEIAATDKACPTRFSVFKCFQNITRGAQCRRKCQLSLMHPINGENGKWRM